MSGELTEGSEKRYTTYFQLFEFPYVQTCKSALGWQPVMLKATVPPHIVIPHTQINFKECTVAELPNSQGQKILYIRGAHFFTRFSTSCVMHAFSEMCMHIGGMHGPPRCACSRPIPTPSQPTHSLTSQNPRTSAQYEPLGARNPHTS